MKIALFAWGAEDDTKVWSGTPSTLNHLFKEKGFKVICITKKFIVSDKFI